jgi:hypothetical protein
VAEVLKFWLERLLNQEAIDENEGAFTASCILKLYSYTLRIVYLDIIITAEPPGEPTTINNFPFFLQ